MVEVEEIDLSAPIARKRQFSWLLNTFIRPGRAMHEVASEDRAVWIVPMLLLTLLMVAFVLVAGPLRKEAALNAQIEPPPSFEWMTPEQQQQWMQAQQSAAEPVRTHLFPAIGSLVGLWFGWFVLGSILHLVLTMLGSRSTNTTIYNIAAWASLPFAVRLIVQIIAMITARQLITSPGLSGFLADDVSGGLLFLRIMLSMVDLYLLWQILLLWFGSASTSGLTKGKAFTGVMIAVVLLLALSALPSFLMSQLSGLSVNSPFFF